MALPVVLVPGLLCSPRLYREQMPLLWRSGPVMVADHTRGETMADIAEQILKEAPPRFALVGLSMGGYISLEIMRRAAVRVDRLALLDTQARPDLPEQSERRRGQVQLAKAGRLDTVLDQLFPLMVHADHLADAGLRQVVDDMAADVGVEAFERQQNAIIGRADSRPSLGAISCRTLVLVGDADQITPPDRAQEMAAAIAGAQLVTVPRCGHLSTLERPEEVNQALESWMAA